MRLAILAILLLLIPPASAQQKDAVKVGVTDRPDNAALIIAMKRGYFERHGIDLQLVGGGNAAQDFVASLALGQIDVTAGSPSAGLFNALDRGITIRIVADWARVGGPTDSTFALVAAKPLMDDSTIKTPADLKGKAVGIGPVRGGVNDILLLDALKLGHLTLKDIDPEIMGFGDGIAALASKKLAATLLIEPLVTEAERRAIGRLLVPAGAVLPGVELATVYYSNDFAKRTDLATRYMAAYLEGERDYADALVAGKDKDAVIALLTQNTSVKDPTLWAMMQPQHADLNGAINVASLKMEAQFFKDEGTLAGPVPDIDKYVDPSFAAAAVKTIGRR